MAKEVDDQKTNEELFQLKREIESATGAAKEKLFETYINVASDGMQASVEQLPELVIEYLRQTAETRYPALTDVCDGVIERAAGQVVGLILVHARDGVQISISQSCEYCEEVAAMMVCDLVKVRLAQAPVRGFKL